jgi:hypothetical protein
MNSLLYQVSALDPLTYLIVPLLLARLLPCGTTGDVRRPDGGIARRMIIRHHLITHMLKVDALKIGVTDLARVHLCDELPVLHNADPRA